MTRIHFHIVAQYVEDAGVALVDEAAGTEIVIPFGESLLNAQNVLNHFINQAVDAGVMRGRQGMGTVITLKPDDCDFLAGLFTGAGDRVESVRVAIDDGGVKFAVGRSSWTPPLGEVTE